MSRESGTLLVDWQCEKFRVGDLISPAEEYNLLTRPRLNPRAIGIEPYDIIETPGNLLMYGGVSCLWECLIGNGTSTSAQTLTYFSAARAAIGVGDSSTAAAATQTDLQAATNKDRNTMEATFPSHTDGTTSGAASCTWKASWANGDAEFAWNEVALFNHTSGGRMLNRKVVTWGTKAAGDVWTASVTYTLA